MKFTQKEDVFELEIERLVKELKTVDSVSDEYETICKRIGDLREAQTEKPKVKPDTWVNAGTNLVLALMVLKHEELSVITSKAWGLIRGGR